MRLSLFKGILISSLAMIVSGWLSSSWGSDSTIGAFGGDFTPVTHSNQPFLLDSGYADVRSYASFPAPGDSPAAGSVWFLGTTQTAGSGVPYAIRTTIVTNPHLCPVNFNPVVTVTPFKSLAQGNESMRACADSISVYGGTQYWFGVWVNAVTDVNGNYIPATSYYWSVYCYPASTYATTSTPSAINANTGGPCAATNSTFAKNILLWDTGYEEWPNNSGASTHTLSTNRLCPVGYTPYATAVSTKTLTHGTNEFLQGGGICVNTVSTVGAAYRIIYLTNNSYTTQTVSSFMSTTNGSNWFSLREFGNVSNSFCPYGICGPTPYVTAVTNTDVNAFTDTGGIQWAIYCYPPGLTPPAYSASCTSGSNPF